MLSKLRKKNAPIGVKIIFTLIIIYGIYFLISGLYSSITSLFIGDILGQIENENPVKAEEFRLRLENRGLDYNEATFTIFAIFGLVLILLFGFLMFKIAQGIWKRKNWSRITLIILVYFLAFGGLISLFDEINLIDILSIFSYLIIGTYLMINKNAIKYFKGGYGRS